MTLWISHSNPAKQSATALACLLAGAVLAVGFRHASLTHLTDDAAGLLLGLMLLVIGAWAFIKRGKQTITIDPARRCIFIEDITTVSNSRRVILFSDILKIGIGYLGKESNQVTFYYLELYLKGGEKYALFAPGRFYAGSSNETTVQSWRTRLEALMSLP